MFLELVCISKGLVAEIDVVLKTVSDLAVRPLSGRGMFVVEPFEDRLEGI